METSKKLLKLLKSNLTFFLNEHIDGSQSVPEVV